MQHAFVRLSVCVRSWPYLHATAMADTSAARTRRLYRATPRRWQYSTATISCCMSTRAFFSDRPALLLAAAALVLTRSARVPVREPVRVRQQTVHPRISSGTLVSIRQ